jgi:6-phosphogluconolactonase
MNTSGIYYFNLILKSNMLDKSVKIFRSPYLLAEKLAEELVAAINESAAENRPCTIALSGGSTPELLFSLLGNHFSNSAEWDYAHFFWGDERCVPSDNSESNYGMARRKLFDRIEIPVANIHRIKGDAVSESEAVRYSNEILKFTETREGLPRFDLIILGLGEDGHTASLFPGNTELIESDKICEVAVTNQCRITITAGVINNANRVVFLVTGKKKAEIVEKIIKKKEGFKNYPASLIVPVYGDLLWYIDIEAGSLVEN